MKKRNQIFRRFTQKINYSSCNEDARSELKALRIGQDDIVLAVSGSGARSLDLLISRPKKIISIDMNPLQNYLLELKIAAIKNLPYDEYLEFLGVRKSAGRISIYKRLRKDLSAEAKEYWNGQSMALKRGIIYQGRWERYFKSLSLIVKLFRGKKIKKLFTFTDTAEQIEFCRKRWNTKRWRKFILFVCHRFFWKYIFQDPGFYRYVPKDFPVGDYIYACLSKTLEKYPARENHFFSLLVHNKYINENSLPIYLQEKYYPLLKENVSRIEIVTDSLQRYLGNLPEKSIHKFSLSDISSYTSEADYVSILESCVRVSAPEALFCLRHFLVKREIPGTLKHKIELFTGFGKELETTDMSYAFTFSVGKIV
jgi:S-adenosylmethionine-diacylglycerol 3-amino-3-carboxypropyl transferase